MSRRIGPSAWRRLHRMSAACLLLLLTLLPITAYFGVTLALPGGLKIALYGGSLNIQRFAQLDQPLDLFVYPNPGAFWSLPALSLPPSAAPGAPFRFELILPLWLPASLALSILLLASAMLRTPIPGLCAHCRYPRSDLPPTAPCPECGQRPSSSPS